MNDLELHEYFENMVRTLRAKGVLCAITSGLACVHYGIAESTQDCDLLCHTSSFPVLLDYLSETAIDGQPCQYRGNISPPLDARWHKGGWTSHFEWDLGTGKVRLDVFGSALRESTPWSDDLHGCYAGMQVVAWMKRTDRDKDWPFISSLGEQLLLRNDPRGWLHIYDEEALKGYLKRVPISAELLEKRPLLRLLQSGHPDLRFALKAEREFWQELDRLRIRILRRALRPFVVAMGRSSASGAASLADAHAVRLDVAESKLDPNPLRTYGIDRYLKEARENTIQFVNPRMVEYLPDLADHFKTLHQ